MNDPQVVALKYRVEHAKSVSYENAPPLRYCDSPEFDLTVDNDIARFEFKKFYAHEDEALEAVEPFVKQWEFESTLQWGPSNFSLRYIEAEIIDRDPSPEPGARNPGVSVILPSITAKGGVMLLNPHYPHPPSGCSVDPDDDAVVKMKRRFDEYRLRRAKLPATAYFCVTVLEEKYGSRKEAARKCGVSKKVLDRIATLATNKGGEDARKAAGADYEFTRQEKRFLNQAVMEIILRAAQVAADDSQPLPQITMVELTKL